MSITRRDFVKAAASGAALSGVALAPGTALARALAGGGGRDPSSLMQPRQAAGTLTTAPEYLAIPSWVLDIDGNGTVNGDDRRAIEASLGAARGLEISPRPGYDFRADLLASGEVTAADLEAFDAHAMPGPATPRPVVICWHYGWYHPLRRVRERPTASYLGGDYNSDDPATEEQFNALKHEFGIGAELLSWIDEPGGEGFDPPLVNYARGYFSAASVGTRQFGWLYETAINLRVADRVTLGYRTGRRQRLVEHFQSMARMMLDESGALAANVLRIEGRPVIYMFASHLLGTGVGSLTGVALALGEARQAFIEEAGVAPYLIGDEALFLGDPDIDQARRFRAGFFDAIARYHHYDLDLVAAFAADGPVHLGGDYLDVILANEARTRAAFAGLRNRFTGNPLLVLPSSAAGFAKVGLPTLLASRDDYAKLLRAMLAITEEHLREDHGDRFGTPALPSAPVIVGSWNEEFEGHALFPARANEAMVRDRLGGFEWLAAIKEVYGWNKRTE
jgi:hypothetical protein